MTIHHTIRTVRHHWRVASCALFAACLAAYASAGVWALKASGIKGAEVKNAKAQGFDELMETLTSNLEWVFVTAVGLAVTVGGTLMAFGMHRANEHMIRIGGGIVIIMIVSPGIVA